MMMMPLTWWQNEDEKNNKNFFSYVVKLVNSCLLNMIMMREGDGDGVKEWGTFKSTQ